MPEDSWFFDRYSGPVVYVFHSRKSIPKDVSDCIDGRTKVVHVQDPRMWPDRCHFYVIHAGMTTKAERAANIMGAQIVGMPYQSEWFRAQIPKRLEFGPVWIYVASKAGDTI